jgi:predicted RNase H-like HicB family nuclease
MPYQFHLVFEKGEKYYIGYCPEVPGANGQGTTKKKCRQNLLEAIELILETRAEEARPGIPKKATVEVLPLR